MEDDELIRLVTQLPLSELGGQLLHLQPGSKLGLYLLELSNLPVTDTQVEKAEQDLARPLEWLLSLLHTQHSGLDVKELSTRMADPDADFLATIPQQLPGRVQRSLQAYLTLAIKSGMVTIAGQRAIISLMGIRQLRQPDPVLPLIAYALSDSDEEGTFLRLIMGAIVQAFQHCDWAEPGDVSEIAASLLEEMGQRVDLAAEHCALGVFNDFIYGAGCASPRDATAMVLLQYLVSEALQPD